MFLVLRIRFIYSEKCLNQLRFGKSNKWNSPLDTFNFLGFSGGVGFHPLVERKFHDGEKELNNWNEILEKKLISNCKYSLFDFVYWLAEIVKIMKCNRIAQEA